MRRLMHACRVAQQGRFLGWHVIQQQDIQIDLNSNPLFDGETFPATTGPGLIGVIKDKSRV